MLINAPTVEPRATSLFRPAAYQIVCDLNLINIRIEFAIIALNYWNSPLIDITVIEEIVQHAFVPEKFAYWFGK